MIKKKSKKVKKNSDFLNKIQILDSTSFEGRKQNNEWIGNIKITENPGF